jgi:hypothetical protein
MMARIANRLRGGWIVAALLVAVCCIAGADDPPSETQPVMQAKLAHARNLVEALLANDFQTLDKEAREMAAVTRLAAWSKGESPAYQAEAFEFESVLHMLRELAKKENSKGAALACVTLTLNCVECHRTLRADGSVALGDITVPAVEERPSGDEPTASVWMRAKLERTEQTLAGLVAEDLEAIEEAAASMRSLGRIEAWSRRSAIPRYDTLISSFNYACEQLESGAREGNIEAATLAYAQLLLSCVNCHAELPRP